MENPFLSFDCRTTGTLRSNLADFLFALRKFEAFSAAEAASVGLTPKQHQTLLTISGAAPGTATIGYIAERMLQKPNSATGLIDRLETLGLVFRHQSMKDRRVHLLELTEHGTHLLRQLSAIHRAEIRRLRPRLAELLALLD